jgi:hypothetical protein
MDEPVPKHERVIKDNPEEISKIIGKRKRKWKKEMEKGNGKRKRKKEKVTEKIVSTYGVQLSGA